MKDTELINELFQLWKDLSEVGELYIGKGYSEKMKVLQDRVNKYNSLHSVSVSDSDIDAKYNIAGCISSEKALMEIIYNANKEGAKWMRDKLTTHSR
jgi:hypothetical protein